MKIKGFYLYKSFPYDIYMEIAKSKYIKILSADKPYTINTLVTYAKKNVKWLHIRKDDQLAYLEAETKKCIKAIKKAGGKQEDTILVALRSITLIHQSLLAIGVTPDVLNLCEILSETIIEVVKKQEDIRRIYFNYPKIYSGIASKSLLTALTATALVNKMGWDSATTTTKLCVASILMDFTLEDEEMTHINSHLSPEMEKFSEEAVAAFIQHPLKAAEIAQQFTIFPDVDYLIENHHETPNRKGFPNQPSHSKLTVLSAVFNVSQFIAAEIDGQNINKELLLKTMKSLSKDYLNGSHFRDVLKTLKSMYHL